ncbi:MAG: HAMP domain-containing histidine kinase [Oscillospiraceae bacterium]|nr:HAMP domain-containing histidine kinase [Oscillospiraceae bacterium]
MMIAAVLFGLLAAALGWLLWRKNRALWRAAKELSELRHGSGSGNRLRLHEPDSALEELLAQVNSLLEDKEAEQRSLRAQELELRRQIANISHDLRTPLTSILGYLQLLEQEDLPPKDRQEGLDIIRGRALALQSMITSFYDLSRLEAGEYPIQRERVQLYPLLAELLADFYSDFEAAGLTVELALEEHLPPVWGDRSAILRLFTNLIQNVLKHGSGVLTVRLADGHAGQSVSFTNDAPDLTQEDVTHVFDRFFTADKMRSGQNTGLGLAIVRELSRRMEIGLSARLDQGRFTVELQWQTR